MRVWESVCVCVWKRERERRREWENDLMNGGCCWFELSISAFGLLFDTLDYRRKKSPKTVSLSFFHCESRSYKFINHLLKFLFGNVFYEIETCENELPLLKRLFFRIRDVLFLDESSSKKCDGWCNNWLKKYWVIFCIDKILKIARTWKSVSRLTKKESKVNSLNMQNIQQSNGTKCYLPQPISFFKLIRVHFVVEKWKHVKNGLKKHREREGERKLAHYWERST